MKRPIQEMPLRFSRPKLEVALAQLLKRYPLHPKYSCLCLTHSLKAKKPKERIYDGAGPLFDRKKQQFMRDPLEFTLFNREFEDLYLYEVYKKVCAWSPLRIGRVRVFLRNPGTCLHMHTDDSPRYHIAISTNSGSYFFFEKAGAFHIPANGRLYKADTTELHTVFNAGETSRVHMIFDTIEWRFLPKRSRRRVVRSDI